MFVGSVLQMTLFKVIFKPIIIGGLGMHQVHTEPQFRGTGPGSLWHAQALCGAALQCGQHCCTILLHPSPQAQAVS
jgi:hypothetical protein